VSVEQALANIAGYTHATRPHSNADKPTRLARVAYDHDPDGPHGAAPRVQFDGEDGAGRRRYPTLYGYRPTPGVRVLLIPAGRDTYVVAGPMSAPEPTEWLVIKDTEQSVTNSTSLVDDTELYLDVAANATYRVILAMNATGSTASDIKVAWSIPAGSDSGGRWLQGPYVSQDPGAGVTMQTGAAVWSTERSYGCSSSANSIIEHGLLRTGASPGRLQLRWAQNAASTTATVVNARSNLWVKRFR